MVEATFLASAKVTRMLCFCCPWFPLVLGFRLSLETTPGGEQRLQLHSHPAMIVLRLVALGLGGLEGQMGQHCMVLHPVASWLLTLA